MLFWNILALVVAVVIWAVAYFNGYDSHTFDGWLFLALVLVEIALIVVGSRKQGNSGH